MAYRGMLAVGPFGPCDIEEGKEEKEEEEEEEEEYDDDAPSWPPPQRVAYQSQQTSKNRDAAGSHQRRTRQLSPIQLG